LCLFYSQVTDASLKNLQGVTQLRSLSLVGTRITDAGLEYLIGLKQLKDLNLSYTQVTNAGVGKLQQALPKCRISHSL